MEKRKQLEEKFNKELQEQELLFRFQGDNEFIILGAPGGHLVSRIILSFSGILLVSMCLIGSDLSGGIMNTTFSIGGSLLGLIIAGTPFISFYSRKHFKILFSRKLRQISIERGVTRRQFRIDFSHIDYIECKRIEMDDFVNNETSSSKSYHYRYSLVCNNKHNELFSISSRNTSLDAFANDFAVFLSQFTEKEAQVLL